MVLKRKKSKNSILNTIRIPFLCSEKDEHLLTRKESVPLTCQKPSLLKIPQKKIETLPRTYSKQIDYRYLLDTKHFL